jgi:FkbM family methyltransferase
VPQEGHSRNGLGEAIDALERARAAIGGGGLSWSAPSRFKAPGQAARRLLRRVLRPYTLRQGEVDSALVEGLQALADRLGGIDARLRTLEGAPAPAPAALEDLMLDLGARLERLERRSSAPAAVILDQAQVQELATIAGPLWYHRGERVIAGAVERHGLWEPDITSLLPRVLRPGMTFVDVGANIGYFPVIASRLVGPTGRVVAVEPEPRNLELLRANLWRHDVRNCTVLPVCAYTERGQIAVAISDEMRDAWIAPGEQAGPLMPCARLDDLLEGRRADVIKIDCEGADHLVVRGAEGTIAANPEIVVVVEFLPRVEDLLGETPREVLAYYESLGLGLHALSPYGFMQPATAAQLMAAGERCDVLNIALRRP